ncbi:VrrA/YqfQ family protein [Bacillus sp. V5-8f]|uniref:VrrA/YqfQ family protein n=1 Tax=Bacillus sp. V5-8f TaxID=2053044 RepID=UPI0015E11BAA|nr:VrrA/YqfQ family protein [Bacillus sp. V5-8f]
MAIGNPTAPKTIQQQSNGGLISKLLGKSKSTHPSNASLFSSPSSSEAGSDILQALKDPAKLNSMIANTQKVLSAAEQIGAMVQQYGPLIKNLPEMWKIYRSMSDSDDSDEPEEEEIEVKEKKKTTKPKSKKVKKQDQERSRKRLKIDDGKKNKETRKETDDPSPKLYI